MANPKLYPVFLDLCRRPVLIVGGGSVALRKAAGLTAAGARVTVVSPAFCTELETLDIARVAQSYDSTHMTMTPWRLVFAATNDPAVNRAVAADAASHGLLCCRCDEAAAGDFVGGAVGSAGEITLAVSTGKASPVMAVKIRDQALAGIDPVLVTWTELLASWRESVLSQVKKEPLRRAFLQRLAGAEMEAILRAQGARGAQKHFAAWLREARHGNAVPVRGKSKSPKSRPARPSARGKMSPHRGGSHVD